MAKLRKWAAYRKPERPYTRFSKVRGKAFVKSRPGKKVIKYTMGDLKGGADQFPIVLQLISKDTCQVRANAIEAARISCLRPIEKVVGRTGFFMKIMMVPHQAIRENPLAAGAGADRLSTGMKHSFGKIIGTACRVEAGKVLFELYVQAEHENLARTALKAASKKLPLRTTIDMTVRKAKELTVAQVAAKEADQIAKDAQKAEQEAKEAEAAKKLEGATNAPKKG